MRWYLKEPTTKDELTTEGSNIVGGKKVYFSDTGILNLLTNVSEGQMLETAIFNQLKQYGKLSFYNRRNMAEIDFILNKEIAFEVKQKALPADQKRLIKLGSAEKHEIYLLSV